MFLGFLITAEVTILASGETNSSDPIDAGAASHEATPCRSEANVERGMIVRLAAHFPMLHRQIAHVSHSRGQFLAAAISMYVFHENLFHVRAEKPFRALLVGLGDLLVKGCLLKIAAPLFYPRHGLLQIRGFRAGNQEIAVQIDQKRFPRHLRNRPWIVHHDQRNLGAVRSELLALLLQRSLPVAHFLRGPAAALAPESRRR